MFKCITVNENNKTFWIAVKCSPKFILKGAINSSIGSEHGLAKLVDIYMRHSASMS